MSTFRIYSPFRNSSPAALASTLGFIRDFEITFFKFRSSRHDLFLNATLLYSRDNQAFYVLFRKCGKYPKFFGMSPNFAKFDDLLDFLVHFDDEPDSS